MSEESPLKSRSQVIVAERPDYILCGLFVLFWLLPITWVGTCRNPVDDRDYLISYNDCCGKSLCNRCMCHNTERERPVYFPSKTSSVLWCFGTESRAYHCTIGVVLGEAVAED